MGLQEIKPAPIMPPTGALISAEAPEQVVLLNWITQLSQQVSLIQDSFRLIIEGVAGGLGSVTVTLRKLGKPAPYPDSPYIPLATPSWSTTVYIASPADITPTTVKYTFGTAAPGGGGFLYLMTAR